MKVLAIVVGIALAFMATGCGPGPVQIRYGTDACTHCKMTVSDKRFACAYTTTRGRTYPFDAIECMVQHLQTPAANANINGYWVSDFSGQGALLPADNAYYLQSEKLQSPMGGGLAAFANADSAAARKAVWGGTLLRWPQVRQLTIKLTPGAA
jgi:copper chaperone NosL